MTEITLKFETSEEAAAFIKQLGLTGPVTLDSTPIHPQFMLNQWYKPGSTESSVRDPEPAPATAPYAGMNTRLEILASTLMPDHVSVSLHSNTYNFAGFEVCWHKSKPHIARLVKRTNSIVKINRLRLVEESCPKTQTLFTRPTKNSRRLSKSSS